jgi:hypothetical protein
VAAPAMAPTPPPIAAPMPAPRPPPAIAPMTAPVPAPNKPPPIARSAGLYGSAEAVVANNSPAPITLAIVDCFLIRSTRNATERTNSAVCSSVSRRFRLAIETPRGRPQHYPRSRVGEVAAVPAFRRTDHRRRGGRERGRRLGSRPSGVGGLAGGGGASAIGPNFTRIRRTSGCGATVGSGRSRPCRSVN